MTTMDDEACQALWARQRKLFLKMHRTGKSLLNAAKTYVPAMTKPTPAAPAPKADRVVIPIRVKKL